MKKKLGQKPEIFFKCQCLACNLISASISAVRACHVSDTVATMARVFYLKV